MKKIELTVGKCDMDALEELLYSEGVKTYVTVEFTGAEPCEDRGESDAAAGIRLEFYLSDIDLDGAVSAILGWCRDTGDTATIAVFSVEERITARGSGERSISWKKVEKCLKPKNRVF